MGLGGGNPGGKTAGYTLRDVGKLSYQRMVTGFRLAFRNRLQADAVLEHVKVLLHAVELLTEGDTLIFAQLLELL